MTAKKRDHQVDLTAIQYPSDRVTFRQIRERQPNIFDNDSRYLLASASELDIISVFHLEQVCARKAFAKAAGLPDPEPRWHRSDLVEMLNDAYREYNISSGIAHTREQIRHLESLAAAQARAPGRPGR